jgi:hypothetical protein
MTFKEIAFAPYYYFRAYMRHSSVVRQHKVSCKRHAVLSAANKEGRATREEVLKAYQNTWVAYDAADEPFNTILRFEIPCWLMLCVYSIGPAYVVHSILLFAARR